MTFAGLDLYLVRHGQTAPNAQRRYPLPGDDAGLSETGERQAAQLTLPMGTVYSSPARRAVQTAQLAGYPDLQTVPELQEANFGVMAGHTWADLEARFGDAPTGWTSALSDPESHLGPPGGETGAGFHTRIQGWLHSLPASGTVLAFTHLGPVLAVLRLTVGLRAAGFPNVSVAHLRRSGSDWWLVSLMPGQDNAP